jgi:hypothetical protein
MDECGRTGYAAKSVGCSKLTSIFVTNMIVSMNHSKKQTRKRKRDSNNPMLAAVKKEMAKPRMALSTRRHKPLG